MPRKRAGVLSLYSAGQRAFTDDHGRLVQMIAPHLSQAIARARRGKPEADIAPTAAEQAQLRLVSSR